MTNISRFILTNDSITIIIDGKTHVVRKGAPNFGALRAAIVAYDEAAIRRNLTAAKSISSWAKGRFTVEGDVISYDGRTLPSELNKRVIEMVAKNEDPTPLFNFWEKLQKNPSKRSVEQLWPFLSQKGIPLTKEGNFLAYKGINDDFTDVHSRTFDNSPGNVHEMPRNQISDDPNEPCHEGFHVGALEYATSFGSRIVICEVEPADVVCIPYDHSHQKMRVAKYKVIGNHNGEYLSSTTFEEDLLTQEDIEEAFEEKEETELVDDFGTETYEDVHGEPEPLPEANFKLPKKYAKLHEMDMVELLDVSTEKLREYASRGLKIVGASKIPGGKVALITTIYKVRGF